MRLTHSTSTNNSTRNAPVHFNEQGALCRELVNGCLVRHFKNFFRSGFSFDAGRGRCKVMFLITGQNPGKTDRRSTGYFSNWNASGRSFIGRWSRMVPFGCEQNIQAQLMELSGRAQKCYVISGIEQLFPFSGA